MKKFELPCYDGRKSFYGKAWVIDNGKDIILKSYETDVCGIINGQFVRFWDGESVTTMRHINSLLKHYGVPGGGLAWWRNQNIVRFSWVEFYLGKAGAEL